MKMESKETVLFGYFIDLSISISIIKAEFSSDSKTTEYSLAGITQKDLTNGSVVFLDEMNIFAYPKTVLGLKITALINHKRLGNLVSFL